MKKTVVKKLNTKELPLLSKLFHYKNLDEMITENKQLIENNEIDIFALFINSKLIGELRVMYSNEDNRFAIQGQRAYLYAFRIDKKHQGKGYGRYLLAYVLNDLKAKGYTEFTVGVEDDNARAIHIYKSFGFNDVIARKTEEYQGDRYEYNLYLKSSEEL